MDDGRWTICYDCMYTVYYGAPGILSPTQTPTISVCRLIKGVTYQVSMHTSAVEVVQPSLHDRPSYIEYRASEETPQLNLSYQLHTKDHYELTPRIFPITSSGPENFS